MRNRYKLLMMMFVILFIFSNAFSQVLETNSIPLERKYEPIELKFSTLDFDSLYLSGIPTSRLFLYAYYSGQGWQPVPFQIDEKDAFKPSNNVIDTTDVLIFLTKDLGDRVDRQAWINNPESQSNQRYEIEVVDLRDRSKKGWCYLFISSSLTEQDKSPTKYISFDAQNDIIMSDFYQITYGGKWYPENISVTTDGGGNNTDFYDRTKVRFIMLLAGGNWTRITEDELVTQADSTIEYTQNPVIRLKRKIPLEIYFFGQPSGRTVKFSMTYYPYSMVFSGDISLEDFQGLARVKYVRMSYDLNASAVNMKFFSGDSNGIKNQNVHINGTGDLDNTDTSMIKNEKNWTMVTGTPGTMLTLNNVRYESNPPSDPLEPHAQYLYYWDNSSGSILSGVEYPAEFDWDSGDSASYGDHGMFFESYALTDSLHYLSTTYLLGKDQTGETAQNMFDNFNAPVLRYVREQKISTGVEVADSDLIPTEYRLRPNFPNPFNPNTTIAFDLPKRDHIALKIFDLQGKLVRTLVDQGLNAGIHNYTWDGQDNRGQLVSSGIYIYSIQTDVFTASRKMAFVK